MTDEVNTKRTTLRPGLKAFLRRLAPSIFGTPILSPLSRDDYLWIDRNAHRVRQQINTQTIAAFLESMEDHPEYERVAAVKAISMLHTDVLLLMRWMALSVRGSVLEIGPYIGGSTIAMASGLKQYNRGRVVSIEAGGDAFRDHPHIPSVDIIGDLKQNLQKWDVIDSVDLIQGRSDDANVQSEIRGRFPRASIGLFFIDADGNVQRDMETLGDLMEDRCFLVLDDYVSEGAPEKALLVKAWVEKAESAGLVESLGVFGWGTWFGIYRRPKG